jgi:hypothetical protein
LGVETGVDVGDIEAREVMAGVARGIVRDGRRVQEGTARVEANNSSDAARSECQNLLESTRSVERDKKVIEPWNAIVSTLQKAPRITEEKSTAELREKEKEVSPYRLVIHWEETARDWLRVKLTVL